MKKKNISFLIGITIIILLLTGCQSRQTQEQVYELTNTQWKVIKSVTLFPEGEIIRFYDKGVFTRGTNPRPFKYKELDDDAIMITIGNGEFVATYKIKDSKLYLKIGDKEGIFQVVKE